MIVIEGMDNTGKTTLLTRLAEDLGLVSIKTFYKPNSMKDISKTVAGVSGMDFHFDGRVILDRIQSISEPVYGPICRGNRWMDREELNRIHDILAQTNPFIIHCRPKDSTVLKFGDREQMDGVIKYSKDLLKAYDQEMLYVADFFPVCTYDYERHTYESILALVKDHLHGVTH